ncbi:flagellar protein FlgN [Chromobacterium vaccinii]|uniref:flagellar protein FlgN n=1 Tax=Chromobacterium vaccinii TaxID=1108595 RepID=UPI000E121EE0|nr:flagellar protein FlgN [Chromobacterium vaccinii]SUX54034.1 FlgN protein [Chromobacterium vaccinii]
MDRKQRYRRLFATVGEDLADYPRLNALLERQFRAALAHDAAELDRCAGEIAALCDKLERSRRERLELVTSLLPSGTERSMAEVLKVLPQALREQGDAHWRRLRALIADCRERNLRNGQLLQERRQLLQRVLEGESDVYAAQ